MSGRASGVSADCAVLPEAQGQQPGAKSRTQKPGKRVSKAQYENDVSPKVSMGTNKSVAIDVSQATVAYGTVGSQVGSYFTVKGVLLTCRYRTVGS